MIRFYLKTTLRNLSKNRLSGMINIAGLAIGLAVFIMIMLWIGNELSYNNFHQDKERIAALMVNKKISNNEIASFPAVPTMLTGALTKTLPGVEYAARTSWGDVRLLSVGEKRFLSRITYSRAMRVEMMLA